MTNFHGLSSHFEILGNMWVVIICFLGNDVTKFEFNLSFLIKPFYYMTKIARTKKVKIS